jgi:hypothetical protein
MTVRVGIVTNPLAPSTWEEHEADDPRELIQRLFPEWPQTARIYDLEGVGDWKRAASIIDPAILARRDVTPRDEAAIERLGQLRGPLLVTVPPADPITAIIAVVAIAVGVAAAFLLMPKVPNTTQRPQSPNNSLSERSNQARPGGRVADIFGTVESVPDLLMVPYSVFEGNREVEIAFMAIGRGSYSVSRVRDGDTSLASIAGASAAIYGPEASPNNGAAPQLQIGSAIAEEVQSVVKLNEVNGQTLKPTNVDHVQGEDSIRFVYPDSIESNDSDIDFTDYFSPGDAITVEQANISGAGGSAGTTASARFLLAGEIEFESLNPTTFAAAGQNITIINGTYAADNDLGATLFVDLSGTYLIDSVTATKIILTDPDVENEDWLKLDDYPSDRTEYGSRNFSIPTVTPGINLNGNYTIASVGSSLIVLNNPALVNSDWNDLDDLAGDATEYVSPAISRNSETWAGPYIVDLNDNQRVLANFVAMNGLYTLSKEKGKQKAMTVGLLLELTPVNGNDAAIGAAEQFAVNLIGSDTERTMVGVSLWADPSFTGRCSVRARRTTPTPRDDDYGGIVDEVKWRDCYGLAPIEQEHFGDVTTVHTRTVATPGALALKSRKLNMRVTRKLPQRLGGSVFGEKVATDSAADIMAAICLDPFIGRRSPEEIDFESIYDTVAEVESYFGSELAGQFGYTFDDVEMSFEETFQTVAQAAFCTAYRQGRVIRLTFERAGEESSLIFNARNTIPATQKRSVRFGPLDDHDGVELDFIDPADGAAQTLSIPPDIEPNSPQAIEPAGIRSYELAYWHAWRAWNKIRFQNIAVELESTQEASLVIPKDRVLISDLTRPDFLQGEVEEEIGTTLKLSHEAPLDPAKSWTIFLQHIDGTIEALDCEAGADSYHVELGSAPRMALSTDAENFARSTYMIAPESDVQTRAFLITEREPNSNFTEMVRGVNYSFLYYQNDELVLWLPFELSSIDDASPYRWGTVAAGGGAINLDDDRGWVFEGAGAGSQINLDPFDPPASYTKAAWIRRADLQAGQILSNANESFGFAASDQLQGGHGGVAVSAEWPAVGEWHHAALAFDSSAGSMALYIDGALADEAEAVAGRTLAQLTALKDFLGRAQDLRLWKRALSGKEILEVYRATKIGAIRGAITTEDDRALVTESGERLIW